MSPADRKAERRRRLLDAAFELLGTEGSSATTVRAVCARSRLNPRYFYENFDDLDALVVAVYDRVVAELGAALRDVLRAAADDRESQVRASVECIVHFVDDDRRRGRVLYVEALGNEALNRRRIETGLAVVGMAERYPPKRARRTKASDQTQRVHAAILVGGFSELLVAWIDGRIDLNRKQLIDRASTMFLALQAAADDLVTGDGT